MGIRVRKLARQMRRSPVEVLGLLHAIGFPRYRSVEDMVSETVAGRLREAERKGVKPVALPPDVQTAPAKRRPEPKLVTGGSEADRLMQELLGDGQRQGRADPPVRRPQPTPPPQPVPVPPAAVDTAAIVAERDEAVAALAQVKSREVALTQRISELEGMLAARDAIVLEGTTLEMLLEERGLRGADEMERALAALGDGRHLLDLFQTFTTEHPEEARKWLRKRLVLFGGSVPADMIGIVGVTVSPDRAERPGLEAIERSVRKLSETLMLHGKCRVLIVGGGSLDHRLIRTYVDRRVHVRFRVAPTTPIPDSWQPDGESPDLILLWGAPVVTSDEGAKDLETVRVSVAAGDLVDFCTSVVEALDRS